MSKTQKITPPRWADQFLNWFCSPDLIEEIQGDLYEAYHYRRSQQGARKARMFYILDVIKFFKPYSFRKPNLKHQNHFAMIRNYFKVAFRNFRKDSFYSTINVLGLALGIALSLLIIRFAQFENGFDRFHNNIDRVYRINKEIKINDFDLQQGALTPYAIGERLKQDLSDLTLGRIGRMPGMLSITDKNFIEDRIILADPEIVEILTFNFLKGNQDEALTQPNNIVLTEPMVEKYFGDEDPLGKLITYDNEIILSVSGVVKPFPENSHLDFDFLVSMETVKKLWNPRMFEHYGSQWTYTYVLVPELFTQEELDYQLESQFQKYAEGLPFADRVRFFSTPLKDIHLYSNYDDEFKANGNALLVQGSVLSAIIILFIACFNFMNLTTARGTKRAKEVGVRKTIGASRSSLITQHLVESFLMVSISCIIAISLAQLLAPVFNQIIGRDIPLGWSNEQELLWIGAGIIIISLIAGSYPALYLTHFSPMAILGSQITRKSMIGATSIRKGLVILQFAASIALIIATIVVYSQLGFVRNKELGFNKENVLIVRLNNDEAREKRSVLAEQFKNNPNVLEASLASNVPSNNLNSWRLKSIDPSLNIQTMVKIISIDYDYLDLMEIEIVEGRNFSRDFTTDQEQAILLNQAAVEVLGLENPIGTEFDVMEGLARAKVIGVVENFHESSMYDEIAPLMMKLHPSWYWRLVLKVKPGNLSETISSLEATWKQQISDWPFEFSFLDQNLEELYEQDQRLGKSFMYFSILAIFIACMGLFGLASFSMENRIKEIGIRKAMGAGIGNILPLLYKDFMILVMIAFILAAPVAWYFMDQWLQNFVFHISIDWKIFVMSGLLAAFIAVVTIGYQSLKAARSNPVDSLRYE